MSAQRKTAANAGTVTMTVTDPSEQVTPDPAPESPRAALAREATEHAEFLTKVRETAYQKASDWGICSSGRNAFLSDVGIPAHPSARYASSDRQPVITVDPYAGMSPEWVTDDGVVALVDRQRMVYQEQRQKIARGILRARSQGYGSDDGVAEVFTDLGLTMPAQTLTATVRLGYDSYVTVKGIAQGTTEEEVTAAFRQMIGQALAFHLPGWQSVTVADGFRVDSLTPEYDTGDGTNDSWTF